MKTSSLKTCLWLKPALDIGATEFTRNLTINTVFFGKKPFHIVSVLCLRLPLKTEQ